MDSRIRDLSLNGPRSAQSESAGMPSTGRSASSSALSRSSRRYGAFSNVADDWPRRWMPARVATVGAADRAVRPPAGSKIMAAAST
jgi:hypothetical protein